MNFQGGDRSLLLLQSTCREETAFSRGLRGEGRRMSLGVTGEGAVPAATDRVPLGSLGAMLGARTCLELFINQYFVSALSD